jgi:hypothetical protein
MAVKYPLPVKPNKLTIKPVDPPGLPEVSVPFNPSSYSISKTVAWTAQSNTNLNAPPLTFGGGGSRTLQLELFFDVTEPIGGLEIKDVRELTNAVAALARKVKDGSPPVCEVHWGAKAHGADFPFKGVVTNLIQRFTHFRSTGEPVRAVLTLTFTEYRKPGEDQRETDPELTTRVVKRGDTVTSIATEVYRDPGLWRVIAQANGLDDPRRLGIGRVLTVPKVR